MEAIATLVDEHRVLETALDALEGVTLQIESGGTPPAPETRALLEFLGDFADGRHHRREEAVLIPALEQGCGGRYLCPHSETLDRMQREHREGHALLARMREAFLPGTADGADLGGFVGAARSYLAMLRAHIRLEEDDLFPDAELILAARDAELVAAYERPVRGAGAPPHLEACEETARRLRSELARDAARCRPLGPAAIGEGIRSGTASEPQGMTP